MCSEIHPDSENIGPRSCSMFCKFARGLNLDSHAKRLSSSHCYFPLAQVPEESALVASGNSFLRYRIRSRMPLKKFQD